MRGARYQYALILTALLVLPSLAVAQIAFDPSILVSTGAATTDLAIADFDDDGLADLALATNDPPALHIMANTGEQEFMLAQIISLPRGGNDARLAASDMNNDGLIDLVVALPLREQVLLLMNTQCFGFIEIARAPIGQGAHHIAIGDLDNDGVMDAAVANHESNSVTLIYGFATPEYRCNDIRTGAGPCHVAIGEFDWAQHWGLDLAVTNSHDRTVWIFRNLGSGDMALRAVLSTGGSTPDAMILDDFDLNGQLDVAVSVSSKQTLGNGVVIFYNHYDQFSRPVMHSTGGRYTVGLTCSDFNGDGHIDLVAADVATGALTVLVGSAKGVSVGDTLSMPVLPGDIFCSDLNRDGLQDLIVLDSDGKAVAVLYNITAATEQVR